MTVISCSVLWHFVNYSLRIVHWVCGFKIKALKCHVVNMFRNSSVLGVKSCEDNFFLKFVFKFLPSKKKNLHGKITSINLTMCG